METNKRIDETNVLNILGDDVSSQMNDTILGAGCGLGDMTIECVRNDTACTRNLDICKTVNTCDLLDTCPDSCLSDEEGCGTSDNCTANYVYYGCGTDNTIATRSWFNNYVNAVSQFTSDLNRVLIKGDLSSANITPGTYKIKQDYATNQAILRRDVGYRSF